MRRLILAHDLGTSGNKAVLVDEEGRLIDTAFASYRTAQPEPLAAEQEPADWWRAVVRCTRALLASDPSRRERLVTVGFSGHMNGVVLVDEHGVPIRPALLHADIRAQSQCDLLRQRLGEERYYLLTGNRIAPFTSLPKLMLLQEREPEAVRRARWMLQSKDYCAGRLTGRWGVTDPSDASLTGAYDASRRQWCAEVVEASGAPARLLPEVVPSTTVVGRVSREAAQVTGLPEGLPVVLGAGDGASATMGAGVVEAGDCYTCLGSTAWTACLRAQYQPDPQMRLTTLLPAQPGRWVQYGTVQSAGSAWSWFRSLFGKGMRWERLIAEAQQAPAGSDGVLFLPYLTGERAPIWNPRAQGVFFGLQAHHTRAHLARAVLEGVACALGSILRLLREQGAVAPTVRVVGGAARNPLWMQILADLYGCPVEVPQHAESSTAVGAAVIAGVGVGLFADFTVAKRVAAAEHRYEPQDAGQKVYAELSTRAAQLYDHVRDLF